MVERQDAAALVGHAADLFEALLEVGAGLRVDDRVGVETQGAGRPVLRHERLNDRKLRIVSGGSLEAHVDVRQEEARFGRVPRIAPDRLHRQRGQPQIAAEERLVRLARVERRESFRRVIGPVEHVEEIFAASVELRPDEGRVGRIDALDREIMRERRRVDASELVAVLAKRVGERRPGRSGELRQRLPRGQPQQALERVLETHAVGGLFGLEARALLRVEHDDRRLDRVRGEILESPASFEEESDDPVSGRDGRGASRLQDERRVRTLEAQARHVHRLAERRMIEGLEGREKIGASPAKRRRVPKTIPEIPRRHRTAIARF